MTQKDLSCLDALRSFRFGFAVIGSGGPLPELTHSLLTHGKEGQRHVLPAPRFRELGHLCHKNSITKKEWISHVRLD